MLKIFKRSRKAQGTWPVVVGLVAFLAIVAAVLLVAGPFAKWLSEESSEQICKLSVLAKYGVKKASVVGKEAPTRLECYTQDYYASQSALTKEDQRTQKTTTEEAYGRWKTEDKFEAVQRQIALAMYNCYDQFWQGKYNFYTEWGSGKEDLRCVICAEFNFDPIFVGELKSAGFVNVVNQFDMRYFLEKEKINQNTTYLDYFNKGAAFPLTPLLTVDTSQSMSISFVTISEGKLDELKLKAGGGAAVGTLLFPGVGTIGGGLLGAGHTLISGDAPYYSGVTLSTSSGIPCRKLY